MSWKPLGRFGGGGGPPHQVLPYRNPPVTSLFLSLPAHLSSSRIDPQVTSYFCIWKPKQFSFGGRSPNPGHSSFIQLHNRQPVVVVNNLPDKGQPVIERGLKATLPPVVGRIGGSDTENLFHEEGWAQDLTRPFDISYFKKPSGSGRFLDSMLSFNKGHTLHVIAMHGLPPADLPHDLLTRLSTYALKDNNCHHGSLSAYIRLFQEKDREVAPEFGVIGELYTAEVLQIMLNQSVMMNVSLGLSEHRMKGLIAERRSIDLDSVFGDKYQHKLDLIAKDADREKAAKNKEEVIQEATGELLAEVAPELQDSVTTPSHKAENPPPTLASSPDSEKG